MDRLANIVCFIFILSFSNGKRSKEFLTFCKFEGLGLPVTACVEGGRFVTVRIRISHSDL